MRLCFLFLFTLIGLGLVVHPDAYAAIVKSIPAQDLQGENGLAVIQLPLGHTVNLSFINSGELVRQVHLDDRGKVVISFDSPLCPYTQQSGGSEGCKAGASVIYLRQIKHEIAFEPNAVASYQSDTGDRATALTVITTRLDGSNRKIYNFELQLTSHGRAARTIQIVSSQPLPRALPVTNRSAPAPVPSNQRISLIRQGLAKAYAQNLIAINSPVRNAMTQFFRLIEQGETFDNARAQSEVPSEFLDWLQSLATS
jgi:hypothetical protein